MPPGLQAAWNLENCWRICWRSMLFDRVTIRVRQPPLSVPGSTLENNTIASQQVFSCDTFRTLINFEIAYSSRTGQSCLLRKYLISLRVSTRYCWNSGEIDAIFADSCRNSSRNVGELTFNPRIFQLGTLKIHEDSVASASLKVYRLAEPRNLQRFKFCKWNEIYESSKFPEWNRRWQTQTRNI